MTINAPTNQPAVQEAHGVTDLPGQSAKTDQLGMRRRCEGVAQFLRTCDTPMTLSVTGGWGVGKTTAMNFIRESVDGGRNNSIWFNTWQFSVLNQNDRLILDLLQMLLLYIRRFAEDIEKNTAEPVPGSDPDEEAAFEIKRVEKHEKAKWVISLCNVVSASLEWLRTGAKSALNYIKEHPETVMKLTAQGIKLLSPAAAPLNIISTAAETASSVIQKPDNAPKQENPPAEAQKQPEQEQKKPNAFGNLLEKGLGLAADVIKPDKAKSSTEPAPQTPDEQPKIDAVKPEEDAPYPQPEESLAVQASLLKESIEAAIAEICEMLPCNRLYIFIDDLDRLNPQVALELMEGMKNFIDCPGCVFILAVDQDIVERGLREKYGNDFTDDSEKARQFFDKIIQVPYAIPTNAFDIGQYVRELLPNEVKPFCDRYTALLAEMQVRNPRTIKRAINLLQLLNCIEYEAPAPKLVHHTQKRKLEYFAMLLLYLKSRDAYAALAQVTQHCRECRARTGFDQDSLYRGLHALMFPAPDSKLPESVRANADSIRAVVQMFFDEPLRRDDPTPFDIDGIEALIYASAQMHELIPMA